VLLFTLFSSVSAQTLFPANVGDKAKYAATIETPKAYLSGICMMYHDENGEIRGSFFNEFGISALDFCYYEEKDKVKLHHVTKMLNKWYIKKVLRRDLRELIHQLKRGNDNYKNDRYHLSYQFTPIETSE
jgi:hypothetical protein